MSLLSQLQKEILEMNKTKVCLINDKGEIIPRNSKSMYHQFNYYLIPEELSELCHSVWYLGKENRFYNLTEMNTV